MLVVKQERLKQGISGAELARRAGLNSATVSQAERGIMKPYPVQAEKMAKALNWQGSPQELFIEADKE